MSVSLNAQNIFQNTAQTFGVATIAAAVTVLVNKAVHGGLRIQQNVWYSPSFLISQGATLAGAATTYALTLRATLVSFPVDFTFLKYHFLHLLFGAYFGATGILIYSTANPNGALAYGALASLWCLSTNAAGSRISLFAAGAVGIAAGLRV